MVLENNSLRKEHILLTLFQQTFNVRAKVRSVSNFFETIRLSRFFINSSQKPLGSLV